MQIEHAEKDARLPVHGGLEVGEHPYIERTGPLLLKNCRMSPMPKTGALMIRDDSARRRPDCYTLVLSPDKLWASGGPLRRLTAPAFSARQLVSRWALTVRLSKCHSWNRITIGRGTIRAVLKRCELLPGADGGWAQPGSPLKGGPVQETGFDTSATTV